MRSLKPSLAVLVLLFTPTFSVGQEAPARLTQELARKDAKTFVQLLEDTHPDPYTNLGGKIAFKRKAQQLLRDLPAEGLSVPEFTDRLGAFLAPLKDGHTRVRGSRERWSDPSPKFAVQFDVVSDGILISAFDLPELKGTRGYKLIAVNGHSVDQLLERMTSEVAAENVYGTYYGLTIALRSAKLLKNLIPDLDRSRGVTYTLESPDGKRSDRTMSWEGEHPADPKQWAEKPVLWTGFAHPDEEFYYRFLPDGHTAYFRVANMMPREGYEIVKNYHVGNLKDMLTQYYKAHKQTMPDDLDVAVQGVPSLYEQGSHLLAEMKEKGTPNLIVDLRGNGGGSTPTIVPFFYQLYGDAYFGRPADAEFVQVHSQLYLEKYNSTVEAEKKKNPDFTLGEYSFSGGNETGTAEEKRLKRLADFREHNMPFSSALAALNGKPVYRPKKVIVLCDPGTFSAAFQAAFMLHQVGATVVGVPSAQSPNAFMEATEFTLPESRVRGSISNGMQMFLPKEPRANIFHPDFETTYSIAKKYNFDSDSSLRYALDLLSSGKI